MIRIRPGGGEERGGGTRVTQQNLSPCWRELPPCTPLSQCTVSPLRVPRRRSSRILRAATLVTKPVALRVLFASACPQNTYLS